VVAHYIKLGSKMDIQSKIIVGAIVFVVLGWLVYTVATIAFRAGLLWADKRVQVERETEIPATWTKDGWR
jgi:uncharacterized membrane protein